MPCKNCSVFEVQVEVEVKLFPAVTQQICLGVGLPYGAHDQIFVFSLTIAGFSMWGTLSDNNKTFLSILSFFRMWREPSEK
jgi:hypothetical protein